jgi:hypothetical protein
VASRGRWLSRGTGRGTGCREIPEARALGVEVPEDAFAFSPDPAGHAPWNPDTMTHRSRRVGITSSLKERRHYSATQLLAAGTDLNTVAGRLGHAEGSTTLRFYAQFTRPADQRAAAVIPAQLDGLRKRERVRVCTISTNRLPAATALLPSPASSVHSRGWKKILLWRGSPSSQQPISDRSSSLRTAQTAAGSAWKSAALTAYSCVTRRTVPGRCCGSARPRGAGSRTR